MDPIISAQDLGRLEGAVLFDVRAGPDAAARYAAAHLQGARLADLEVDLSARTDDAAAGGRHPMPSAAAFSRWLGQMGVTPQTPVVAYDDQAGANAAARLWWMLRAVGHEAVQVLDGGWSAALSAGLPTTEQLPLIETRPPYPCQRWQWPMADIDRVDRARRDPRMRVLDVRAAERYRGEVEPLDPIAGHIPGACNIPLSENLLDGRFKSAEALRALYQPLVGDVGAGNLIVHCGSGVTACHTLLALQRAGLGGASLYVGSWSQWCRQPDRPREP